MSEPPLDLETVISHERPPATAGHIQVDTVDDDTQVTLSIGDECAITNVVLSPAEAQTIATALETAAKDTHHDGGTNR